MMSSGSKKSSNKSIREEQWNRTGESIGPTIKEEMAQRGDGWTT